LGGSGTKFLATMLNKSKNWNVEHEGMYDDINGFDVSSVNEILNKKRTIENYGDVNGFLRTSLHEFSGVDKKAIILRDPKECLLSWYDHWQADKEKLYNYFCKTYFALVYFDKYLQEGISQISFKEMTTNPDYLNEVAKYLGIIDVTFTQDDCNNKINTHYKNRIQYSDIPEMERLTFEHLTDWFTNKYIL